MPLDLWSRLTDFSIRLPPTPLTHTHMKLLQCSDSVHISHCWDWVQAFSQQLPGARLQIGAEESG